MSSVSQAPKKNRLPPGRTQWQEVILRRLAEIGVEKADFIKLREKVRLDVRDSKDCWYIAADHFLIQAGLEPEFNTRGLVEGVKDKRVDVAEEIGGKFEPTVPAPSAVDDIDRIRWVGDVIEDMEIEVVGDCPSPAHHAMLMWARSNKDAFFSKLIDLGKALHLKTVESGKAGVMRDDARSQRELIEKVRQGYLDDRG